MFCGKCGAQIKEGAQFCGSCGEAIGSRQAAGPGKVYTTGHVGTGPTAPRKISYKMIGIIACAVVAVIVVIVIAGAGGGGGYNKIVSQYCKALETDNADILYSLLPNEFVKYLKSPNAWFSEDDFKSELRSDLRENMNYFEKEYGENIKIKYKIADSYKHTKDELIDFDDELVEYLGFKRGSLQDAFDLELALDVRGNKGSGTEYYSITVYKINGKWCLLLDEYY